MKINTNAVITTAIGMALGTLIVVFLVNPLIERARGNNV